METLETVCPYPPRHAQVLLYDEDGLVTEGPWGIYYKPDFNFGGVTASPWCGGQLADELMFPKSPRGTGYSSSTAYRLGTTALCGRRYLPRLATVRRY